jgi:hypothetical protein
MDSLPFCMMPTRWARRAISGKVVWCELPLPHA